MLVEKGKKKIANLSNIRTSLLVACSEAKLEHEVEICRRYYWASTVLTVWERNYTANYIEIRNLSFIEGPPSMRSPCCHFATQPFLSSITVSLVESSFSIKIFLSLSGPRITTLVQPSVVLCVICSSYHLINHLYLNESIFPLCCHKM